MPLWALSEIVKAQAGILESDTPNEAAAKLHTAVESAVREPRDAAWVEPHLRALAGGEAANQTASGLRLRRAGP